MDLEGEWSAFDGDTLVGPVVGWLKWWLGSLGWGAASTELFGRSAVVKSQAGNWVRGVPT